MPHNRRRMNGRFFMGLSCSSVRLSVPDVSGKILQGMLNLIFHRDCMFSDGSGIRFSV